MLLFDSIDGYLSSNPYPSYLLDDVNAIVQDRLTIAIVTTFM
jgi:hypothetical protein